MELLIVSGLSGAGKSVAMNALEDIGFFCIDNVPAGLLPSITAFSKAGDNQLERVALSMDVRGCRSREQIETALQQLDEQKLRDAINATGYEVKGVKSAPYEKKGFFSFLKK